MAYKKLTKKQVADVFHASVEAPTTRNLKPRAYLKDQYISFLVPASALAHEENPEKSSLLMKIQLAVLRYHQNGDFNSTLQKVRPAFHVFFEKMAFNKEKLGYDVVGWIKM